MKNLLLLLCAICAITITLPAQTVDSHCWNFEESCSDKGHAFSSTVNCIPNASSAYGTADIYSTQVPPAVDGGSGYVHMYAQYYDGCQGTDGQQGEGIFLNFNFQVGHTYKISFLARKQGVPELRAILVNNMPSSEGGSIDNGCNDTDKVPAVPPGSLNVTTLSGNALPTANWGVFTQTVTPGSSFNQLWFRPRTTLGTNNHVFLDNVCIQECPSATFEYDLCKIENHDIQVTATAPAGTTGEWILYNAIKCNGGTGNDNIYADALAWSSEANPVFNVQVNTGCYVLQYTVASSVQGCPDIVVRKLFDSAYGGSTWVGGAFFMRSNCASPIYTASFTPRFTGSNAQHHWALYNAITHELIQTYTTSGASTLNIVVNYGTPYYIEHWATLFGTPLCYKSDVYWATFGCGSINGLVEKTGSYPLSETIAVQPTGKRALADHFTPKNSLVFPNPASTESVTLQVNDYDKAYNVAVRDIQGHLIQAYNDVNTPEMSISSQDLTAGIYFIQISYATGAHETLKLVIVK
ncbi:MAG TPA: T9SS type A sorting domain-containing protein [Saprospiraceae bacterium]|nr:T9SS type A sorting domain-containing protein [Saprospiraceae bacterium]